MSLRDLRTSIMAIGKESWFLFCAVTVANASNYLFHVIISRSMDPGDYSALGAVLAILILLSVPLGAVQTTVAKRLAQNRSKGPDATAGDWTTMLRTIAPVGVTISVVLAVASPLLSSFLRLDSTWTALFVASYVLPALILTVLRGVLQGRLRFRELAFVSVFPMLVRLAVGIPIVKAGGGVAGAVGASVIAESVGVICALWLLGPRGESKLRNQPVDMSFLKEILPIMAGLAAMWLVIELDLVLARRFLSPASAGEYAAAGLLARAVLFVPGAISLVALPHFSRNQGRGMDAHRWLMSSVALVVGLGLAAAVVLSVAGTLVVRFTFGNDYMGAARLLPLLSLGMVGMGVANLLIYFHIAAGSRMFHLLWPIAALEAAAIGAFHSSGSTVATIVLITAWVASLIGFGAARSVSLSPSLLSRLPNDLLLQRSQQKTGGEHPELSIVIPTYNGGKELASTVRTMVSTLDHLNRQYELIVVSDGSTDGSADAAGEVSGTIDVLHYTRRQGKGVALRVGMTRARGRYVAFIDGDGDIESGELSSFLALMDMYEPDMVIGSKRHPLSAVHYPLSRRIMSWCYQRIVRMLFGLNVRDTQTGMKMIRREVIDAVLPRMLEKRFAFDLEFMVVARRLGFDRFFEAPIRLDYRFSSTVSLGQAFRILLDTGAIFYRRYILRFYDFPTIGRPVGSPLYSAQLATLAEHAAGP